MKPGVDVCVGVPLVPFSYVRHLCTDSDEAGSNQQLTAKFVDLKGKFYFWNTFP